jgi:hypothetical protein
MLTSLTVKVTISSEDVEEIVVTSDQLGQESISRQTTGNRCKEENTCPGLI